MKERFNSIRFRSWLTFVLFSLIVIVFLYFFQVVLLSSYYEYMKIQETASAAKQIKDAWSQQPENLNSIVSDIADKQKIYIEISDSNRPYFRASSLDKSNKEDKYARAHDLLCKVGLEDKINSYPSQMSGGEQQRVAIAIALANNPKILLADEPTGAVDTKTSNMIQDLFRKLNEELGITIIIVTHDISLANKVGRVVMIADGKISTEKIMKESYKDRMNELATDGFSSDDSHEEFSILDKANRVQISPDMLAAAGIDSNKVKVQVENGKVIITKE